MNNEGKVLVIFDGETVRFEEQDEASRTKFLLSVLKQMFSPPDDMANENNCTCNSNCACKS